jgi:hypothetical protein
MPSIVFQGGDALRRSLVICGVLIALCALRADPALALQQLIPAPYPQNSGPNSMEGPIMQPHDHQHLLPDAAPALNGPNALGNPHFGHLHRHQHLVPEPYPRQWWERYYWE